MLEKQVEQYLVKKIKALGGVPYKFTSPAHRSVPDRLILMPDGKSYFVELKRPGGKPTAGQQAEHERIKSLGHAVFVLDCPAAVDRFLELVRIS